MKNLVRRFIEDESGATAIEYGLIAALLAVGLIGGMTALSGKISTVFQTLITAMPVD